MKVTDETVFNIKGFDFSRYAKAEQWSTMHFATEFFEEFCSQMLLVTSKQVNVSSKLYIYRADGYWSGSNEDFHLLLHQFIWMIRDYQVNDEAKRKVEKAWSISKRSAAIKNDLKIVIKNYASGELSSGSVLDRVIDQSEFVEPYDKINARNGVIDLKTKSLIPHSPQYLFQTKLNVDYYPSLRRSPTWEQFIITTLYKNQELIRDFQKLLGAMLFGKNMTQTIVFLHGAGQNGKSVTTTVLEEVLRNYSGSLPVQTFYSSSGVDDRNLAFNNLRNIRFVTASETAAGKKYNDALIKQITGGDRITCRGHFQEFGSYKPSFNIVISTNHLPAFNSGGYGINRRVLIVPFHSPIGRKNVITDLEDKLLMDKESILHWLVEGACAYYEESVDVGAFVDESLWPTYSVFGFMDNALCPYDNHDASAKDLYDLYRRYCELNHQTPVNQSLFGSTMNDRYYKRKVSSIRYANVGIYSDYKNLAEGLNIDIVEEIDDEDPDSFFAEVDALNAMFQEEDRWGQPQEGYDWNHCVLMPVYHDWVDCFESDEASQEELDEIEYGCFYDPADDGEYTMTAEVLDEHSRWAEETGWYDPPEMLIF